MQPVNPDDYPNGELVLFPGDTNSTLKLMQLFELKDQYNDVAMKQMVRQQCLR